MHTCTHTHACKHVHAHTHTHTHTHACVRAHRTPRCMFDGRDAAARLARACAVVDTVSANGAHKVLALWRYDKASINGAPFVYRSAEARAAAGPEAAALIEYALRTLDALGWRWGPTHIEVKLTSRGPRLVEVNAGRWNGLDHKLLADLCFGSNAIDATIGAFVDEERFADVPATPPAQLACAGRLVTLCSSVQGVLARMHHEEEVEALPSLLSFAPEASVAGDRVSRTVDLDTAMGYALLAHSDPVCVEADYATLNALQPTMWEVS
jgi:hypothetical protein